MGLAYHAERHDHSEAQALADRNRARSHGLAGRRLGVEGDEDEQVIDVRDGECCACCSQSFAE